MKVKIQKFNPAKDAKPYYKTYDVPWKKNMTVLEAIMYVYEILTPSPSTTAAGEGCADGAP